MIKLTEKLKRTLIANAVKVSDSISFIDEEATEFYIKENLVIDILETTEESVLIEIRLGELLNFGTHLIQKKGSVTLEGVKIVATCNLGD
ncbi:hypothetical protein DRN75_00945 [Nanoarchaeota archaeon]|nr:MAG: hypothetical protein DRN75_00945 [Nanoarchaeota archaeon]